MPARDSATAGAFFGKASEREKDSSGGDEGEGDFSSGRGDSSCGRGRPGGEMETRSAAPGCAGDDREEAAGEAISTPGEGAGGTCCGGEVSGGDASGCGGAACCGCVWSSCSRLTEPSQASTSSSWSWALECWSWASRAGVFRRGTTTAEAGTIIAARQRGHSTCWPTFRRPTFNTLRHWQQRKRTGIEQTSWLPGNSFPFCLHRGAGETENPRSRDKPCPPAGTILRPLPLLSPTLEWRLPRAPGPRRTRKTAFPNPAGDSNWFDTPWRIGANEQSIP